jgi:hypothetical protein
MPSVLVWPLALFVCPFRPAQAFDNFSAALPQRFSDGLCIEVSVPISLPVVFPFSIPVGPGDDGRGLCVELVLPIPSALGFAAPLSKAISSVSFC